MEGQLIKRKEDNLGLKRAEKKGSSEEKRKYKREIVNRRIQYDRPRFAKKG